jgi:uncharacterized protein (UPF0332 family)
MSFEWKEYLELAKDLSVASKSLKAGKKEAYERAAISRAYYGVFKLAEELLVRRELLEPLADLEQSDILGGSHSRVLRVFKTHRAREGQLVGFLLQEMKKARVLADYHSQFGDGTSAEEYMKDTITNANEVLKLLRIL